MFRDFSKFRFVSYYRKVNENKLPSDVKYILDTLIRCDSDVSDSLGVRFFSGKYLSGLKNSLISVMDFELNDAFMGTIVIERKDGGYTASFITGKYDYFNIDKNEIVSYSYRRGDISKEWL